MIRQRGFTLFELVLAVATTSIVITIALPAYQDYSYRTQMAHFLDLTLRDRAAVQAYQDTRQQWPRERHEVPISDIDAGPYLEREPALLQTPRALYYKVSLGSGVAGELLLEADFADGVLRSWRCRALHHTPGFARYLPAGCQTT